MYELVIDGCHAIGASSVVHSMPVEGAVEK